MTDRPTLSLEERRTGGRIEFTHPDTGVMVRVERPELNGRALWASVELRMGDDPDAIPLVWQSTNLMSPGSIKNLWRDLREPYPKVPWAEILTQASYTVVGEHLRGGPAIRLADLDPPSGVRWVLEPFVEEGGATILAAAGELGKSYLCLAAAISVATGETLIGDFAPTMKGPVLYLDWETNADTHNYRLRTICAGAGIDPGALMSITGVGKPNR